MPEPVFTDTLQVAVVVRDLDATMRTFVQDYGLGPFEVYEMPAGAIDDFTCDGEPAAFGLRIALGMVGSVEWELIQPTDDFGPYAEFLAKHGEGLHHVGMAVRDFDDALGRLQGMGHSVHIGGSYQGVRLAYMTTNRDIGAMTEIFDLPKGGGGPTPDSVYPPAAA
jgi:hypothetical protein